MSLDDDISEVEKMMSLARSAQMLYEAEGSQELYDRAALAVGWAVMEPARNVELSSLAVATTGLGDVADKITKNHRKTLGLLRDIAKVCSYGVIEEDRAKGLTKIARPIGVVGAVVPSTNPVATPANNIMNALKCGNAIVLSPSPKGLEVCEKLLGYIHAEFDKIGLDRDLVQMLKAPGSKAKTQRMLELCDLAIVTGSQDNVRRAYSSGTPAIGVGAGNVAVIVDESADLQAATAKIKASKCFDNATSCSSENALIVVDAVYDEFVQALSKVGGFTTPSSWQEKMASRLFPDGGSLSRDAVAQSAEKIIEVLGLADEVPEGVEFICVQTEGIGKDYPWSGEKLSRVLSLYRAKDFTDAKALASSMLLYCGAGHSVGLHSAHDTRAVEMGLELPTCRVILNQAHCFATGGAFHNGMPFSLSMGCGSWGGNSIDDNLHWKHFLNITKVVREIPEVVPQLDSIFSSYWDVAGR